MYYYVCLLCVYYYVCLLCVTTLPYLAGCTSSLIIKVSYERAAGMGRVVRKRVDAGMGRGVRKRVDAGMGRGVRTRIDAGMVE